MLIIYGWVNMMHCVTKIMCGVTHTLHSGVFKHGRVGFSRNSQNFPSHVSIPNIPLLSTFITERQNDPKSSNKCLRLNALSLIRPQCIGHVYHVCQVNWHVRRPCHDTLTRGWKVGSVFTVQHTPPLSDHTSHSSQTVHHQFVRRGRSNQKDLALK